MIPEQPVIGWFDINAVDRDNILYHLAATPSQEAWLAQKLAEAQHTLSTAKRRYKEVFGELFMECKSKPYIKTTSKGNIEADASDAVATHLVNLNPRYHKVSELLDQAQHDVDLYKGYVRCFETKKTFMASLAGIKRTEMQQKYN